MRARDTCISGATLHNRRVVTQTPAGQASTPLGHRPARSPPSSQVAISIHATPNRTSHGPRRSKKISPCLRASIGLLRQYQNANKPADEERSVCSASIRITRPLKPGYGDKARLACHWQGFGRTTRTHTRACHANTINANKLKTCRGTLKVTSKCYTHKRTDNK